MRDYPVNSPQAMSRLIALALLADGGLDRSELDALERSQVLQRLQIDDGVFQTTTAALCDDMLQCVGWQGSTQLELDEGTIDMLLGEVTNPRLQIGVLRAMLDIVDADGWLADGEAVLISRAMAAWQFDLYAMIPRTKVPATKDRHVPTV